MHSKDDRLKILLQNFKKGETALEKYRNGSQLTKQEKALINAMWNTRLTTQPANDEASYTARKVLKKLETLSDQITAPEEPQDDPVLQLINLVQGVAIQVDQIHQKVFPNREDETHPESA